MMFMRKNLLFSTFIVLSICSCATDDTQREALSQKGKIVPYVFNAIISESEQTRVSGTWGSGSIRVEWEPTDRIGVFAGDEAQAALFTVKELDGTEAVFEGETLPDAVT